MMWVCCAYRIASDRQERWRTRNRLVWGLQRRQRAIFNTICGIQSDVSLGEGVKHWIDRGMCLHVCVCVCALCDRLQSFPYSTRHCVQCCWSALNGSTVRRSLRHDGQGHTTKTFGDGLKLIVSLLQAAHTLWRFYSALWWIAC